jgi:hypothetical protein
MAIAQYVSAFKLMLPWLSRFLRGASRKNLQRAEDHEQRQRPRATSSRNNSPSPDETGHNYA